MRRRPGIAGIKATQAERVRGRAAHPASPPPLPPPPPPPPLPVCRCLSQHATRTCCRPTTFHPQGQFRAVGEAVAETQAAVMRGQMTEFKDRLEEFALRHKADIRGNPEFRRAGLICCVFLYGCICCKWWFTIEAPGPRRDQARNPEFRCGCRLRGATMPVCCVHAAVCTRCRHGWSEPAGGSIRTVWRFNERCSLMAVVSLALLSQLQGAVPRHVRPHRRGPAGLQQGHLEQAAGLRRQAPLPTAKCCCSQALLDNCLLSPQQVSLS